MTDEPFVSPSMNEFFEILLSVAKSKIETVGEFDPFGAVRTVHGKKSLIEVDIDPNRKGKRAELLKRAVQDAIRQLRETEELSLAGLIFDANVRPLEGGEPTSGFFAWVEEMPGNAMRFLVRYEIQDGHVVMGDRQVDAMDHRWLV